MRMRILYVSRAAPGTDLAAVHTLIRAAHPRNAAAGLTGALVFLDGWFAQALEGPVPALEATFVRIARDPRHVLGGTLGGETIPGLRLRERALVPLFAGQALALRTAASVDPRLLADFGYRPGFPPAAMPADFLLEFLVRACRRAPALDKVRRAF